ncbi:MAG: DegV family protein, partial [Lachnospiraceae bacterium]|nr:DegV family protein [Lachnospiraceae bacterium]
MRKIKIMADSTCDLSQELLDRYDISILPLYIVMDEKSYLDGIETTPDEIYAWSDRCGKTPKTAAVGIDVAERIMKPYDQEDTDLIMFGISEAMSS